MTKRTAWKTKLFLAKIFKIPKDDTYRTPTARVAPSLELWQLGNLAKSINKAKINIEFLCTAVSHQRKLIYWSRNGEKILQERYYEMLFSTHASAHQSLNTKIRFLLSCMIEMRNRPSSAWRICWATVSYAAEDWWRYEDRGCAKHSGDLSRCNGYVWKSCTFSHQ